MLAEEMQELAQELPAIPVRKVVRKVVQKSRALLASLTPDADRLETELIRPSVAEISQK